MINPIVDKIRKAIKNTEFENRTYIVGGAVRDYILGKTSQDIDMAVELPEGGIRLATFLFRKNIATKPVIYKNFGTAQNRIDSINIEYVMTRKESYRHISRKPDVEPATLREDAYRRDFTINAIYYDISQDKILDITEKGIKDINKKIIRTVTTPDRVFHEDPLRMLRAVKFAVKLNFKIEKNTYAAIKTHSERLSIVSIERIAREFQEILISPFPDIGIKYLIDTNLMKFIIPEIYPLINLPQNKYHNEDAFLHTLNVLKNIKNEPDLRMAALLHDIGKPKTFSKDKNGNIHFYKHEVVGAKIAKEILKRLKFSKSSTNKIVNLIRYHLLTKQYGKEAEIVKDKKIRRFLVRTEGFTNELLELIDADNKAHSPKYKMPNQISKLKERIKRIQEETIPFSVNGNDIKKELNLSEGKKIGELLKKAKDLWIENPNLTKEELLKKLQRFL